MKKANVVYTFRGDKVEELQKGVMTCFSLARRSEHKGVKFGPLRTSLLKKTGLMIYGNDLFNVWSFMREFVVAASTEKLQLIRA